MDKKYVADSLKRISSELRADYVYDPEHENRPHDGGSWHKTEKGWSTSEQSHSNENSSPLIEKSFSDDFNDRIEVASDPSLPKEHLDRLLNDKNEYVVSEALKNPNAPIEKLVEMAKSPFSVIRESVAVNPNTPEETLKVLSKDKNPRVQKDANASLKKIKEKKSQEKKNTEADKFNSMTRQEQMMWIAKSDKNQLKMKLVGLKDLTPEVLEVLSKDKNVEVRQTVAERDDLPQNIIDRFLEDDFSVKVGLLNNKTIDNSVYEKLSQDKSPIVRSMVGRCKRTPSDILDILANDESSRVRASVINNPNTAPETLERLKKSDPEMFVNEED